MHAPRVALLRLVFTDSARLLVTDAVRLDVAVTRCWLPAALPFKSQPLQLVRVVRLAASSSTKAVLAADRELVT